MVGNQRVVLNQGSKPNVAVIGSRPFLTVTSGAVEFFAYEVGKKLVDRYEIHLVGPARQILSMTRARPLDVTLPDGLEVHRIDNSRIYNLLQQTRILFRQQRLYGWSYLAPFLDKAIALLKKKPPSIIHIQNTPDFVPHLRKSFPQSKIILHLHNEYLHYLHLPYDLAEKAARESDLILTCSNYLTDAVLREFPGCKGKVKTLYNGVDTERFVPNSLYVREAKNDEVRILFVGRLTPQKGVHILIDAVKRLLEQGYPVRLSLAGSAVPERGRFVSTPYVQSLLRLKDTYPKSIEFLGYVPPQKMPEVYRQHDIFLAPSQWNEPFAFVFLEAMASGLPVVSTQQGGIPELVENGKTGFLVSNPWDADGLVEHLRCLIEDRDLGKQMGIAGRRLIEERFTWNHVADHLDEIYQSLLSSFKQGKQ